MRFCVTPLMSAVYNVVLRENKKKPIEKIIRLSACYKTVWNVCANF